MSFQFFFVFDFISNWTMTNTMNEKTIGALLLLYLLIGFVLHKPNFNNLEFDGF